MRDEDIRPFVNFPIPFIAIDNDFSYLDISTVSINNQLGTYQAVEYLVEQGHRQIGYLHSIDSISSFDERKNGYISAMKHFGLDLTPDSIFEVHYSEEESYQDIFRIFKDRTSLPTAFVCNDDTIAVGAMRAFHLLGLRIPEDISLVGFNNRPNSSLTQPALTTIDVPKNTFGTAAVDALINLIEKQKQNNWQTSLKTRIGTQLIICNSVKNSDTSKMGGMNLHHSPRFFIYHLLVNPRTYWSFLYPEIFTLSPSAVSSVSI